MGVSRRKISTILVLETCFLAFIALVVGLVLGVFGSQVMSVFTAKIFEADLTGYRFVFSPEAAIKSILYFGIIFLVVIVFNIYTVGKCRLIDLLYGERKNETNIFPKINVSIILFVVAVMLLGTAYCLILWNGMLEQNIWFTLSLIFGVLGTFLFYYSLAGILLVILRQNRKFYFHELNMFILRQMSNKINTNFVSVSVVCLTLLLVIGIFSCGYSVQNALSKNLQDDIPYDFSLINYNYTDSNMQSDLSITSKLPGEIINDSSIKDFIEIYTIESDIMYSNLKLDFSGVEKLGIENSSLNFTPLSQYNKLLELTGVESLTLSENEYVMVSSQDLLMPLAQQMLSNNIEILLDGKTLLPASIMDIPLKNNDFQIHFVVSDSILTSYMPTEYVINILCSDADSVEHLDNMLEQYLKENREDSAFAYHLSKEALYEQSITTKALVSFLGIYLGFVFMIVCATILAIQQLSEIADNRERYLLLKKLGVDSFVMKRALFNQILCYFLFPLLLAVIHSIVGLISANEIIRLYGTVNVSATIFATSMFILIIYSVYFGLTYMGSKRMVEKE